MALRPQIQPRQASLHSLAEVIDSARLIGNAEISGITIDSRNVQAGDLFAALRGSDFDGHAYIAQAIERGAAAILAEEIPDGIDHPAIVVEDSRRDLALISAEFYGYPGRELTTIGLTGTDGKTTTAAMITWILREAGIQTGLIGTLGMQFGDDTEQSLGHQTTPESHLVQGFLRQMVESGTKAVVIEATSHGLHMHRLDGTPFDVAAVTNITHEHLEYHKTIENYRAAKGILIQRVSDAGGTVILNADDVGAMSLADIAEGATLRTYGSTYRADMRAEDVVASNAGLGFSLVDTDSTRAIELPMLGEFNVHNALCAISVSEAVGVPIDQAIEALTRAPGVPGRMQQIDAGQEFGVVVDYAHTPASLEKILRLLRTLTPDGKVIVVSGSAGERDVVKRPLQGKVMGDLADIAIITSEDPRNEDPMQILNDVAAGVVNPTTETHIVEDRREAIALAFNRAEPGDAVLLAGKGHETSIIWGFEHRPWNEAEVARELLQDLMAK